MCSYSDHPYTTGVAVSADQPSTLFYGYMLTTPIRDKVACQSGAAEPHVILLQSGDASAYLDLYVVTVHLILLAALFIGLPLLLLYKVKSLKLAMLSSLGGVLFAATIISAAFDHDGHQLVIPGMILCTLFLLIPSYWIYTRT